MTDERNPLREALDIAEMVHPEGEPATPEDFDFDLIEGPHEAVEVMRRAKRQQDAAALVTQAAARRVAQLIGEGGAAAIGDTIYRYRVARTERCIDPTTVTEMLQARVAAGELELSKIVNPNSIKIGGVPAEIRDTFYERTVDPNGPTLQSIPRNRAPKFLQSLQDGETFIKGGTT